MEAGLKVAGGKCLLNSTNYEDGTSVLKVLELALEVWCRGGDWHD